MDKRLEHNELAHVRKHVDGREDLRIKCIHGCRKHTQVGFMSLFDPSKATAQLKSKLASGEPLRDALRTMVHDEGFGLMQLYHAVSQVQGISQKNAMRIVVHETESWGGRRGAAARPESNQESND